MFIYTGPSTEETEALNSLRTYQGYLKSWIICAGTDANLTSRQDELPSFQTVQGGTSLDEVKGPYCRGVLILSAMRELPIAKFPALASSGMYWAPVQAYYAAHGFGLAALAALNSSKPTSHSAFLKTFAHQALKFTPAPFNMTCHGNPCLPKGTGTLFSNCSTALDAIISTSTLSEPDINIAPLLVAKSLMTTRRNTLNDRYGEEHRKKVVKGKKYRALRQSERTQIATNLSPTSFFDFLYRIRIRSNYEAPDMFVLGRQNTDGCAAYYKNLLRTVEVMKMLCDRVIRAKVGKVGFENLRGITSKITNEDVLKPS